MYHQMDTHLFREEKISDKKGGYTDTIVICQDCNEKEEKTNQKKQKNEK
jgi:hypothetical protein